MKKEAETIYNLIRVWHDRDCTENHNDPSIYFAYRRLADHLAAAVPAPDAGQLRDPANAPSAFRVMKNSLMPDAGLVERVSELIDGWLSDYVSQLPPLQKISESIATLISTPAVAGESVALATRLCTEDDGSGDVINPDDDKYGLIYHPAFLAGWRAARKTPAPSGRDPATIEACEAIALAVVETQRANHAAAKLDDALSDTGRESILNHLSASMSAASCVADRIRALAAPADWQQDKAETSIMPSNRT